MQPRGDPRLQTAPLQLCTAAEVMGVFSGGECSSRAVRDTERLSAGPLERNEASGANED